MTYNPYLFGYNNFGYYPPMQQNYPQQVEQQYPQQQIPTQNESYFVWVQGEAGAKSYPVARGITLPLFDSEGDYVYFKSVDENGMPLPLITMKLTKVESQPKVEVEPQKVVEQPHVNMDDYVTKEKYDQLEQRVLELETKPSPPSFTSTFTGNTFNNTRKEKDNGQFTV